MVRRGWPVAARRVAKGVAQVVKADLAHAGGDAGVLEAFGDLAAVQGVAGERVGEDEVVVVGVEGAL